MAAVQHNDALPQMSFLCFGMGAIGTYVGGSLLCAGQKVIFLEHPSIVGDMQQRGLRMTLPNGEKNLSNPIVVESFDQALINGPFNLAIMAIKAYDTRSLLDTLEPWKDQLPPILCLQNGVENEQEIAVVIGEDRVIAGTVTSAVTRRAAGDILLERLRGIGLAGSHPLIPALDNVFNQAGLRPKRYADARAMKWSKMLTNLIANASSAILDMAPIQIFAEPQLYIVEVKMLREALEVMGGLKIPVIDLPATPVRAFAWIIKIFPTLLSRPFLLQALGKGRGGKMPSFHIDLYAGRKKSEVEYLNGAVVRFGEKLGIPTPVNRVLTQTLQAMVNGEISKEKFQHQPERLLRLMPGD